MTPIYCDPRFGSDNLPPNFWSKVLKTPTCWLWLGARNSLGYGGFWHDKKSKVVHRLSLGLTGPHEVGVDVDHLCRNRMCCRPDHLEVVSHRENCRRGEAGQHTNSKRTHCRRGHAFEQTAATGTKRACSECNRIRGRAAYAADPEKFREKSRLARSRDRYYNSKTKARR